MSNKTHRMAYNYDFWDEDIDFELIYLCFLFYKQTFFTYLHCYKVLDAQK